MTTTTGPGASQWKDCPQCHNALPIVMGTVTWCERCGWNLDPEPSAQPPSGIAAAYVSLGRRFGTQLRDEVVRQDVARQRWTWSMALGVLFALLVHTVTLAFAVLGVYILITGWPYVLIMLAGALALGFAWVVRPRLAPFPKGVVSRTQFPALFGLIDRVAQALGARPPDGVVLSAEFNAAFGRAGLRQRRVLWIGVPLFSMLGAQERVALLAHVIWLYGNLLMRLYWRASQRAEYLADRLAAETAGSAAMRLVLDKTSYRPAFEALVRNVALSHYARDLFAELPGKIATVPEREIERLHRLEVLRGSGLDQSHPPTAFRLEHIAAHSVQSARVVLNSAENDRITDELARVTGKLQFALVAEYQRGLYR
jgi:hypothetical protein